MPHLRQTAFTVSQKWKCHVNIMPAEAEPVLPGLRWTREILCFVMEATGYEKISVH